VALDAIGEDVMSGASPRRALQELMRRGTENMPGADRLAAEVNRRRRELLQRNNLDGTLAEVKKLLDEAVLAEGLAVVGGEQQRAACRRRPQLLHHLAHAGVEVGDVGVVQVAQRQHLRVLGAGVLPVDARDRLGLRSGERRAFALYLDAPRSDWTAACDAAGPGAFVVALHGQGDPVHPGLLFARSRTDLERALGDGAAVASSSRDEGPT